MSKSSPRLHSKLPSANAVAEPSADFDESNFQVDYWGDSWAFRLAILAVFGATLLLWTIVIFDFFAGVIRGPAGPGAGRL